jgi:hypothetical protein
MARINHTLGRFRSRPALVAMVLMTMVVIAAALLVPSRGSAQSQVAPQNTGEPSVLGTTVENNTLTTSNGAWSGSPTTFAYQWLRCPTNGGAADGSNCGVIPSATKSAYRLQHADIGFRIRTRVTASNADGSATATSNPTSGVVTAAGTRPVSTSPPTISGTPQVGQTLTGNKGSWSGNPTDYNFSWMRCDANGGGCSNISGALAATYVLTSADLGTTIRFKVGAKKAGSARVFATSVPTAVVTSGSAPPPVTVKGVCANGNSVNIADLTSSDRLLVYRVRVSPSVIHLSTNSISASVCISSGGRPVQGALVYITAVPYNQWSIPAEQATGQNGWVVLRMHRLVGFPVSHVQQLLVMFVRTREPGGSLLGASSRLVSAPVNQ